MVKQPFMCRLGQFEKDKQTLVLGLDMKALQTTDMYRCYIGKNKRVYYEIDTAEALVYANDHTIWTNPKGRSVAILPLFLFKKIDLDFKPLVEPKPKDPQTKLF